jgi:hypothetical protein
MQWSLADAAAARRGEEAMIAEIVVASLEGVAAAFAYWGVILLMIALLDRRARNAAPPDSPTAIPVHAEGRLVPLDRPERIVRHRSAPARMRRHAPLRRAA